VTAKDHSNYHNPQARRQMLRNRNLRKIGAFSLTTTMIRNVIMKGPKIFMMVKMYIVVGKNKTQRRFSSLKVKLPGKKEIK